MTAQELDARTPFSRRCRGPAPPHGVSRSNLREPGVPIEKVFVVGGNAFAGSADPAPEFLGVPVEFPEAAGTSPWVPQGELGMLNL